MKLLIHATCSWIGGDGRQAFRFLARARWFSLLRIALTGSGIHPAPYPVTTMRFSSGLKLPGPESDASPPSSIQDKNGGTTSIFPLLHTSLWCGK
jgi:hypothetical protein